MSIRTRSASIVIAVVVAAMPGLGRAADFTFTGQSGNWSTAANWLNGLVPVNDPTTNVIIQGVSSTILTSLIDASQPTWAINGLTLSHNSGNLLTPDTFTIDPASMLQFIGAGAFIKQTASIPTVISGPVNLTTDLTISSNNAGSLTLAGSISGSGGIIVTGTNPGSVTLEGNNSFSGGLTISPAVQPGGVGVSISSPLALGSGNLTINQPNSSVFSPKVGVGISEGSGSSTTITNTIVVNNLASAPAQVAFSAQGSTANYAFILQNVITNGATDLGFVSASWDIQSLATNGNLIVGGANATIDSISELQPSSVTTSSSGGTLTLTGTNHYSGGTTIGSTDTVNANASGALGSGNITVNGTLNLNATNAAQGTISGTGAVHYAANGGAGGRLVNIPALVFVNGVTSFSNGVSSDSFNVGNGTVTGNSATLGLLDRGIGSGTTANFFVAAGAQIENTDGGLPAVQNLGTNADLIPVVHTTAPLTVAVGAGTPWAGLAGGATQAFNGTLVGNGDFVLAGGLFGNGTAGSFGIVAPSPGGSPVTVTVQGVTISSPLSDYSGVSRFNVTGTLQIIGPNGLGGGNGATPVSADVTGAIVTGDPAALNGNVTLHAGSSLEIDSAGLSGTGTISQTPGDVTLVLGNVNALAGTQINASFLQIGDSVQLNVNNVVGLKSMNPGLNYILGGFGPMQEAEGFNINGGSLFFKNASSLVAGPSAQGDSTIRIGSNGGTIAGGAGITVPILATGPVNFGFAVNAPENAGGTVALANTSNQFGMVSVNNVTLAATSPAALTGAAITLNGGELALLSNVTNSSLPPTLYNNAITVAQSATIADNANIIGIFPAPMGTHPIAIPIVNLGSATLTFNSTSITFNTVNLVGNGTIQSHGPNVSLTISSISDDGGSRSLAFMNSGVTLQTSLTASSPISLANSTLEFDGSSTSSTSPLTIGDRSALSGVGTIHRPVLFLPIVGNGPELVPGQRLISYGAISNSTAGTLTVDSLVLSNTTNLVWGLGTPGVIGGTTNDLVVDNGDLTLAGTLSIPVTHLGFGGVGTYTLFTYAGALTNDGLTVNSSFQGFSYAVDLSTPGEVNLVVSAAPEPATFAMGVPAALMLLRRRRR